MNERKIKNLIRAAKNQAAPEVPFGFSRSVVDALRAENRVARVPFAEQLALLFPRVAVAALIVIGLCVAADFYSSQEESSLTAAVEQVAADEWLVAGTR